MLFYAKMNINFSHISKNYTIAYVFYLYRKNRTDYEQPGFMEKPNYEQLGFMEKKWIPVNAPPIGTSFPPDYKRGFSTILVTRYKHVRDNDFFITGQ
jgi:hypothetical protein